mmetsp:Transcript_22644/g.67005  ORF Transcript_22644/g.67005 Transcript_22644/m.67005 type:complete len:219 (+) Transcript_22644:1297-1953(+)
MDSGGGGVLECLAECLKKLGVTTQVYLVANCTLHAVQRTLANPVKAVFGDGGLEKRNVMQLIHCPYDLMNILELDEWKENWFSVTGKKFGKKYPKPVMTRWWYVGCASQKLLEQWEDWKMVSEAVINNKSTDTAANKVASGLWSLMNEPVLKAHLHFMCAYHKAFIVPHFEWLQKMDERTKRSGFRSRSILERYYLMHCDLTHLKAKLGKGSSLLIIH